MLIVFHRKFCVSALVRIHCWDAMRARYFEPGHALSRFGPWRQAFLQRRHARACPTPEASVDKPGKRRKTPFFKKTKPILPEHILNDERVKFMVPYLGKSSYVMLASGFLMTDILNLRILMACGYSSLTTFHIFQKTPLRIPLVGSFFFVLVNASMALKLCKDRYFMLDEDERNIYDTFFSTEMSQTDFKELLSHGALHTCTQRRQLVHAGVVSDLILILEGQAEVRSEYGCCTRLPRRRRPTSSAA
eukprot:TRINITY_DN54726_c0_g1_i2.p1 TRINITY_DN54726_c0_g1~~TRINITY_DN54726_c0_g1_i2.p1  ORF type:complete len:247 (-),score=27.36 TRINITY_DN54726_c0_g1_i2:87-827(-)